VPGTSDRKIMLATLCLCLAAAGHAGAAGENSPAATPTATQPAGLTTAILGFRVVSEKPDSLELDVDYQYSGDHGVGARIVGLVLRDGEMLGGYASAGAMDTGRGTTRVTLKSPNRYPQVATNKLMLRMYRQRGGAFLDRVFDYSKTWSRPPGANPPKANAARSERVTSRPFASARPPLPSTTPSQTAPGESNRFVGFRIVTEEPDKVVLDVDYVYSGDHGSSVFAEACFANDGEVLGSYAYKPGRVTPGRGTTRITLSCTARAPVETNQLRFTLYRGEGFYEQFFVFEKTWSPASGGYAKGREPVKAGGASSQPSVSSRVRGDASAAQPVRSATQSQPASLEPNRFLGFRVVAEEPARLVLDVDYYYNGQWGQKTSIDAEFGNDGRLRAGCECKSEPAERGRGTARVILTAQKAEAPFETTQLRFSMLSWGPSYRQSFDHRKQWSWPEEGRSIVTSRPAPSPADLARLKSPYVRWAILAAPELEKEGLADALTAVLSSSSALQLVERGEIQKVAKELTLSTLLGGSGAQERLKLGRLLKADALVLLAEDKGEQKESQHLVRMVIAETRFGARLRLDSLARPVRKPEELPQTIAASIVETCQRYPQGIEYILAVPPFVSTNLDSTGDSLRARFANVLESALSTRPGTAVLEIEEAQAVRAEQDLAGGEVAGRVLPVVVQGEFRTVLSGGQKSVKLRLEVARTSGTQTIEKECPDAVGIAKFLAGEAAAQIMQVRPEELQQTFSVEAQVKLLAERADVFARRGEYLPSTSLREACLLVYPDNRKQNEALFREYLTVAPYPAPINWSRIGKAEGIENYLRRAGFWKRAADLLERMIRNRLIDYKTAISKSESLSADLDELMNNANGLWLHQPLPYGTEAAEQCRAEEARCAEIYRRFVKDVVPEIGRLKPEDDVGWSRAVHPPTGGTGKWIDADLLNLALELRYQSDRRTVSKAGLDHCAHVLLDLTSDVPLASYTMANYLCTFASPENPRDFSDEDYVQFLEHLKGSDQEMPRLYGEIGSLLYVAENGRNGQRVSDDEIMRELRQWETRVDAYHKRIRRPPHQERSFPDGLVQIRRTLTPVGPWAGPPPPLPPRVSSSDVQIAGEVSLEPVPITVRSLSGKTIRLGENENWDTLQEYPIAMASGAGFDVFWNYLVIWIHDTPGVLREVYRGRENPERVMSVLPIGNQVWVMTAGNGLRVYTSDGALVARAWMDEGVPGSERGAKMIPIAPGRVLAVCSTSIRDRAWFATLTLAGEKVTCDIFHESTLVRKQAELERIAEDDPRITFSPHWLYRVPMRSEDTAPRFLLSCRREMREFNVLSGGEDYALWVSPDQRRVEPARLGIRDPQRSGGDEVYYFLENGDCLFAVSDRIRYWTAPERRNAGDSAGRTLFQLRSGSFDGDLLEYGGFAYAPSHKTCARVDLSTLKVETLRMDTSRVQGPASSLRWGVSQKLGPMAWDETSLLYKVVVKPIRGSDAAEIARALQDLGTAIPATAAGDSAYRKKVALLYNAGRLDEAKQACFGWVRAFPLSAEARYALCDVERMLRSGLAPNENDRAWSAYPHGTFAAHMLFSGDVFKAVRLPFSSDEAEWYIAELHAMDQALSAYEHSPRRAIVICNAWEEAAKAHQGWVEMSYLAIRAAARLRKGEFDAAHADAQEAVRQHAAGHVWVSNLDELLQAIRRKDRSFEWRFDEPRHHRDWQKEAVKIRD
jgi:hypothetical protein